MQFTKMQGLGNDFVVLDNVRQKITITADIIRALADRHRGVGCDQVLLISPAKNHAADFNYRIFNADGSEAFQCGNGARCVGLFIWQEKLSDKKNIVLETKNDLLCVAQQDQHNIIVDMAIPNFDPTSLPFKTSEKNAPYHLKLNQYEIEFDVVSVGNPHCIIEKKLFSHTDMITIGAQLNTHAAFPDGVNVEFVTIKSRDEIELFVYERGVGMTLACGSGACAAVAVARRQERVSESVVVRQPGGDVRVMWIAPQDKIRLCGSATRVFDGNIAVDHFKK